MGGFLSRHHLRGEHDSGDSDGTCTSVSCRDALNAVAAEHWLTLDQLHCLYIIDQAHPVRLSSLPSPCRRPAPPRCCPPLRPSPPSSAAQCTAKRHVPSCCCASASSGSHEAAAHGSLAAFHPFSLDDSAPPPPSPADRAVASDDFHASYRTAEERATLFVDAVRPMLHAELLVSSPLAPDCLSLVLDFLISPPSLSAAQLIGLALLAPQHLHPHRLVPAAPSATFSDLVLSASGCFVHRRGVIDRSRSLRAHGLRLNFATVHQGLWRVACDAACNSDERLLLDVCRQEEFYFDQRLHLQKAHRAASWRIAPYEEAVAAECSRDNALCMVNDLLLVCGPDQLS